MLRLNSAFAVFSLNLKLLSLAPALFPPPLPFRLRESAAATRRLRIDLASHRHRLRRLQDIFILNLKRGVPNGCRQEGKGGGRNPRGALSRPQRRADIETFTTVKPDQSNVTKLKKKIIKEFLQKCINQCQLKFKHLSPDSSSARKLFFATEISTACYKKAEEHRLRGSKTLLQLAPFSFHNVHFFSLDPLWEKMCMMLIALPRGNCAFNLTCAKGVKKQHFAGECFSNVH